MKLNDIDRLAKKNGNLVGVYVYEYEVTYVSTGNTHTGSLYHLSKSLRMTRRMLMDARYIRRTRTGMLVYLTKAEYMEYVKESTQKYEPGRISLPEALQMAGRVNWFNNRDYHPPMSLPNKIEQLIRDGGYDPEEVAEIPPSVDKNEAIYKWIKQHLEGVK